MGASGDWGSAWEELAALLGVLRCESRELFGDRQAGAVALGAGQAGRPLVWAAFEPLPGEGAVKLELMWTVALDLMEHRFSDSAGALLVLERRLREGLMGEGLEGEALRSKLAERPGAFQLALPGARWRGKKPPLAMSCSIAWSRVASPFEPRSDEFLEGLRAFERDGLMQGAGRALMESEELARAAGAELPKGAKGKAL